MINKREIVKMLSREGYVGSNFREYVEFTNSKSNLSFKVYDNRVEGYYDNRKIYDKNFERFIKDLRGLINKYGYKRRSYLI